MFPENNYPDLITDVAWLSIRKYSIADRIDAIEYYSPILEAGHLQYMLNQAVANEEYEIASYIHDHAKARNITLIAPGI